MSSPSSPSDDEHSSGSPSSRSVGQYLLDNNFLLSALEFHTELLELGHPDPYLASYFSNYSLDSPLVPGDAPVGGPSAAAAAPSTPSLQQRTTGPSGAAAFRAADAGLSSGDAALSQVKDDRIALLEYELRVVREDCERLRGLLDERAKKAVLGDDEVGVGMSPADGEVEVEDRESGLSHDEDVDVGDDKVVAVADEEEGSGAHDGVPLTASESQSGSESGLASSESAASTPTVRRLRRSGSGSRSGSAAASPRSSSSRSGVQHVYEVMRDPLTREEKRLLNGLIRTYLRTMHYKFSLIAFEDEAGTHHDDYDFGLDLDTEAVTTGGLGFLYRSFVRRNVVRRQGVEEEVQQLVERLREVEAQEKKWRKEAERMRVSVELIKADAKLLVKEASEQQQQVVVVEKEDGDGEVVSDHRDLVEESAASVVVTAANTNTAETNPILARLQLETEGLKEANSRTEGGVDSDTVVENLGSPEHLLLSSVIITELFDLLPRVIPSVKQRKRELLIPLILKLLRVDHPNKSLLPLMQLLKRPEEHQREAIIRGAVELWGESVESDSYFRDCVVGVARKHLFGSVTKSPECKILSTDLVRAFYARKPAHRKVFFRMLNKACDDDDNFVRLHGLRVVSSLLREKALSPSAVSSREEEEEEDEGESNASEDPVPRIAVRATEIFARFLEDEEAPVVLDELFETHFPALLSWIGSYGFGRHLLLQLGSRLMSHLETGLLHTNFSNFCRGLCAFLKYLQTEMSSVDAMVEHKSMRCERFKWLLESGIPRIINLIISNDLTFETGKCLVSVLNELNGLYGDAFHEMILVRGFSLILGNERSDKIVLIRKRLYPFFLVGICDDDELMQSFEKIVLSIAVHRKSTYTKDLLAKITDDCIRMGGDRDVPAKLLDVSRKLREEHPMNESIVKVLLKSFVPTLMTSLSAEMLETELVTLLFGMAEKPDCSYELMIDILKRFGQLITILPPSSEGSSAKMLHLFRYYIGLKDMTDPEFFVFVTALFQILVVVIERRKFVREIVEMAARFGNGITNHRLDDSLIVGLVTAICRLYQVFLSPQELGRQDQALVRDVLLPSVKHLRESFASKPEIRKLTKSLMADGKKKTRMSLNQAMAKVGGIFKRPSKTKRGKKGS